MIEISRGGGGLPSYPILLYIVIGLRSQQIFIEYQVHAGVMLEPGLVLQKVCYKISK